MNRKEQIIGASIRIVSLILLILILDSCKKFVEVNGPITSVSSANIYEKDATAASVLTGIYTDLSKLGGFNNLSLLAGLSSDEFMLSTSVTNNQLKAYYSNSLGTQIAGYEFWNIIYPDLYVANAAIDGLSASNTLTASVKKQLEGEARFIRAFFFFYLLNLYGDTPLVLSTDYRLNSVIPRTDKADVWKQIIKDLKDAQSLLSANYLDATLLNSTEERVRPTKWVATALLARVYLYTNDWLNAEEQSSLVINNSSYQLVDLDQVFTKNNDEAIWQIQPTRKGQNTPEASSFIINSANDLKSKPTISEILYTSFEAGDQRINNWINSITVNGIVYPYPYKYKIMPSKDPNAPVYEYSTVFRLAEQYLIRAEARIHQSDKINMGIEDLNKIRDRATSKREGDVKLFPLSLALSQVDALKAVEHERQVELFSEWGHRWLDLKRTMKVDEVMNEVVPKKVNGAVWKSYQQWYPLPTFDLTKNLNLTQNQGY